MIKIRVRDEDYWNHFIVGIFEYDSDGTRVGFVPTITFEPIKPTIEYHEPVITLDKEAIQTLMDDLWRCGVRPRNGEGNEGQLGATEKHLEDMRTLVFRGVSCPK